VRFLTNNGTLNEWMRITSAGKVGIGTTAPAAKLDVVGNLNATSFTGSGAGLGLVALPNTTSASIGVITLGGMPFLHNFGTNNTFIGSSAGNMTMDPVNAKQMKPMNAVVEH
jgi:hypothetical protein